MAAEGFPVARIDEYAKPCEPAIHVLRSVGGKHVKVKKRRGQDILRFRANVRKLILGSIWDPLDHLSDNRQCPKARVSIPKGHYSEKNMRAPYLKIGLGLGLVLWLG